MSQDSDRSLDILGIKPVANSIEKVTDATVAGAKAFLSRVCLPAAEEFGLLLQDQVRSWRANNAARLANKAEELVSRHQGGETRKVSPRIAHLVMDEGSWTDDNVVHDMWAGLLASACDKDGADDSNIVFVSLLKQLTSVQVRVIRYAAENAAKYVTSGGLPMCHTLERSATDLLTICGTDDIHRIDRELDHLRALELIDMGFGDGSNADITPTPLALHLYVRGEGFPGSPNEFWELGGS